MLSLALIALMLSLIPALGAISEAQAQAGFPMYSWGDAMLGRPITTVPSNLPGRVPGPANWAMTATASGGSFAINTDGELFAWGTVASANQMGQGANPPSGSLTNPTRVGTANNWVKVASRGNNVAALNSDGEVFVWGSGLFEANTPTRVNEAPDNVVFLSVGNNNCFVITDEGFMYSWSSAADAVARDGVHNVPGRVIVEGRSDLRWKAVSTIGMDGGAGAAITQCGELFSWGNNLLGRPAGGAFPSGNRPGRVGTADNWVDVTIATGHAAGLNSNGEIYTWGWSSGIGPSIFGRPANQAHPNNAPFDRPGILIDENGVPYNEFVSLHGGNNHFLAFASTEGLWGWGANSSGQLGLGDNDNRYRPTLVVPVTRFSDAAVGGSARSIMLLEIAYGGVGTDVEKRLQIPEGTPIPDVEFTFTAVARSFNNNTSAAAISDNFPPNALEIERNIRIDSSSTSTGPTGGIITLTDTTDALGDVNFGRIGTFAWTLTEVANSSNTNASPNTSSMVYSQAEFELRVQIGQEAGIGGDFYVSDLNLLKHRTREGTPVSPPQPIALSELIFYNSYLRGTTGTATCRGALTISKAIAGGFADPNAPFTFDVTISGTPLCPANRTYNARVYAGTTFIRAETFTAGTQRAVVLTGGQTLVFHEPIPIGTRFTATERAAIDYVASVVLYVNGQAVNIAANPSPNMPLSLGGPHTIGNNLRNSAAFTNTHVMLSPPMGLVIGTGVEPFVLIGATALLLGGLIAAKNVRRKVEETPVFDTDRDSN